MNFYRRLLLVCVLACAIAGTALVSMAQAAEEFGVSKWEAGTCKESACSIEGKAPAAEFYTQAAGHPNFGITDFAFGYKEVLGAKEPIDHVKDVRVDLPPGLAVNPEAVEECSEALVEKFQCPKTAQVGEDEAVGTAELTLGLKTTVTEHFPVFNIERKPGEPARFGVEVTSATLELAEGATGHKLRSVIYLEGAISWHQEPETGESTAVPTGDYHEYFEIKEIPTEPEIVESRLIFWGVPHEHELLSPNNAFLTMPSSAQACASPSITYLHVDSHEHPGQFQLYKSETRLENGTPITATGCQSLPFSPGLSLTPQTTQSDLPDGAGVDLHLPQFIDEPSKTSSPDLQSAQVTLPEGMTIDPSAANGLVACTNQQIKIATNEPIECPAGSELGEASVNAPGIPNGSLKGTVYLATPEGTQPESGKEFRVFLAGESSLYGVGLRLEGQIRANSQTGRLTATFANNPEVPFEDVILHFKQTARTPLANPLSCGGTEPLASLTPYSGQPPTAAQAHSFSVDFDGPGGICPNPLPFSLGQSTHSANSTAGAYSSFTLHLTRADGQQYLGRVQATLPPGLLGDIPAVTLCAEAQANAGTCSVASKIGTASVAAGSGGEPFALSGPVYLTGPYDGAPYGLSIAVPAVAGPFNLGTVVVRAQISVDPNTARIIVGTPAFGSPGSLPAVVGGVPVRLKSVSLAVEREKFMFNPTNCGALKTETTLTSTAGALDGASSPFQVGNCSSLPFKPKFTVSTSAKTSLLNGASLKVKLTSGAGQANIHEVHVELPKLLVARLSTLQKACPDKTFDVNSAGCPAASKVGVATVSTPVLPGKLTGPAYLVSHGGVAFPDLELILSGDGVTVILDGKTDIKGPITSSTFSAIPDVPINAFELTLPTGRYSALAGTGDLCTNKLIVPTVITGQNAAKITQATKISVTECGVIITSHKVKGDTLTLKVKTPAAGRVSIAGGKFKRLTRKVSKATTVTLKVKLSKKGLTALHRKGKLKIKVRVGFVPKEKGATSKASANVKFKR